MEQRILNYIKDKFDFGEQCLDVTFPKQGMSGSVFFTGFEKIGEVAIKYGERVDKDLVFLKLINDSLLGIPAPKLFGSFELDGFHVLVIERIKGKLLDKVTNDGIENIFESVVATLKQIHDIKGGDARWREYLFHIFQGGDLDWQEIAARGCLDSELVLRVREQIWREIGEANFPPNTNSLLHTDFNQSNIFVNEAEDKIVGVVDWEEATWGDPIYDHARFYLHLWHRGLDEAKKDKYLSMLKLSETETGRLHLYFDIFVLHYLAYYSEEENEFNLMRIKMHQDYLRSKYI